MAALNLHRYYAKTYWHWPLLNLKLGCQSSCLQFNFLSQLLNFQISLKTNIYVVQVEKKQRLVRFKCNLYNNLIHENVLHKTLHYGFKNENKAFFVFFFSKRTLKNQNQHISSTCQDQQEYQYKKSKDHFILRYLFISQIKPVYKQ